MGWERLTLGEGLQEERRVCSGPTWASRKHHVPVVGVWRRDGPGGLHGGGCLESSEHPGCAGGWDEDAQPGSQRGGPSEGRRAVVWTRALDGNPRAPPGGSGRAGEAPASKRAAGPARPPPALSQGAAPGSPPPSGDLGASAERKRGAAPARGGGDAAWQRPAAPQVLFRPRLCWQLPAARGRADERALCLRPSGSARLSFLI